MKTPYTKGPWTYQKTSTHFRILDADGQVLSINGGAIPIDADATLIAASPLLLEALKEAVAYINGLEAIPCISKAMAVVGNARQAISAAEATT